MHLVSVDVDVVDVVVFFSAAVVVVVLLMLCIKIGVIA